jgi:hypothetical protein
MTARTMMNLALVRVEKLKALNNLNSLVRKKKDLAMMLDLRKNLMMKTCMVMKSLMKVMSTLTLTLTLRTRETKLSLIYYLKTI